MSVRNASSDARTESSFSRFAFTNASAISTTNDEGEVELTAPEGTNTKQAITQGAPSVVANGSKTIVQYTLVFDSAEQQRKWYDFVRWLKTDAGTDGETTAERILNFIDAHANY